MSIQRNELAALKFGRIVSEKRVSPVHPGDVLLKDFIEPLGLTRYRVAKEIGVPQRRIDEICSGLRAMSADSALRLGRYFGVEAQLWMNLQAQFDLELAAARLDQSSIVPPDRAALAKSRPGVP